jgi:hypothetical protein
MGHGRICLPLGPPAIINGLDPRTPSATVPPPLDPLHVALTPHLPDEIGRRQPPMQGVSEWDAPITHPLCWQEGPTMASGAALAPRWSSLTPRPTSAWVAHTPKTNKLPRVGSGAAN